MNRRAIVSAQDKINLYAHLSDLKEVDYRNALGLTALIELLIEKGVISKSELASKAQALDEQDFTESRGI